MTPRGGFFRASSDSNIPAPSPLLPPSPDLPPHLPTPINDLPPPLDSLDQVDTHTHTIKYCVTVAHLFLRSSFSHHLSPLLSPLFSPSLCHSPSKARDSKLGTRNRTRKLLKKRACLSFQTPVIRSLITTRLFRLGTNPRKFSQLTPWHPARL